MNGNHLGTIPGPRREQFKSDADFQEAKQSWDDMFRMFWLDMIPGAGVVVRGAATAGATLTKLLVKLLPRGGAKLLPAFSRSTVEAAMASSGREVGQTTAGAQAIAKKLGHAAKGGYKSAFEGIAPTQANATKLIEGILSNPTSTAIGGKSIDAFNALGQGVRVEAGTGKFMGFLEAALRSR